MIMRLTIGPPRRKPFWKELARVADLVKLLADERVVTAAS